MAPELVAAAITERTKAIVPVHIYGHPADVPAIDAVAPHVPIIEDAAQAHLARYYESAIGSCAEAACYSFYPGKNLGAYGEGGALVTNDGKLASRARALREHGQSQRYYHDEIGYNYRMDSFQAAILNIKLSRLDEWNVSRDRLACEYSESLVGLPIKLPTHFEDSKSVWHCYVIESERRDDLRSRLMGAGIETGIHYPVPVHLQRAYAFLGHRPGDFPISEELSRRCLSLPIYPELTSAQIRAVAGALRELVAN
jgi:dTDP-4-amino-4,6-dideoxygalactose transaminase